VRGWKKFSYDNSAFNYSGGTLRRSWELLHAGDCEPFPENRQLQQAWRCFHLGDFFEAVQMADEYGIGGHAAANKATGVYATYLEDNEKKKIACFRAAISRAEKAMDAFPDDPNSFYFYAFNLGRYSQTISVVEALKQGIGGKIAHSLKRALELQPDHAEAHTVMGLYHAEIIDKVGKLLGSLTYGASEKEAIAHFETAIRLTPLSPVAHMEYGNGLYLLFGEKRLDEVTDLYIKASEMAPRDAMEKLDVESALAELE